MQERKKSRLDFELNYSVEYVKKILRNEMENGSIEETKSRGGGDKKVNKEVLQCLVCTILDFPEASDYERTVYVNKYGPCSDDVISVKTVNRILNDYSIKTKVPCFSSKERNTFSSMILRYVWSSVLKDISCKSNTLFVFIDEAAVVLGKYKKRARGFFSVVPCVNKPLDVKKMTILAAIVPGFGTIFKWFSTSVKGNQYSEFLQEIAYICRTKICNKDTQIVIIQDNCSIHKTVEVKSKATKYHLNLFSIIPYSPQLNLLAENYFGQMKFFTLYNIKALPNEDINNNVLKQHSANPHKEHIMKQWSIMTRDHYDANSTARIFGAWRNILDMCKEGLPYTYQEYSSNIKYACNVSEANSMWYTQKTTRVIKQTS